MKKYIIITLLSIVVIFLTSISYLFYFINNYDVSIANYSKLAQYSPDLTTVLYSQQGNIVAKYANENRKFISISKVPTMLIKAFLAAEDKNFYSHNGVDYLGIIRAAITNFINIGNNKKPEGASTITQQVAKNFLLSNKISIKRKIKEIILAMKIEQSFSKNYILELYLNQIYLGEGSYGIAAAALNYFGKSLDKLTIYECAYLAALPKAPNNYHPVRYYTKALERRNWVLKRMYQEGFITNKEFQDAILNDLVVIAENKTENYFTEEIRRKIIEIAGEKTLYQKGLIVQSTMIVQYQKIAIESLHKGLIKYDMRQGYNNQQIGKIDNIDYWYEQITKIKKPITALNHWEIAVILNNKKNIIGLKDGSTGNIDKNNIKQWQQYSGMKPKFKIGEIILVELAKENKYILRQIPKVEGAIVVMNPHNGNVLAMSGGFNIKKSQFNRVTQATRQPGSAFKPIVYLTALENGYMPNTKILDAPFAYNQFDKENNKSTIWKPKNYSRKYKGMMTLRSGLEKSSNLMTIHLANEIGIKKIANTAETFDLYNNIYDPPISMAIGSKETTLLKLVNAYSMINNGCKKISPNIINSIQNSKGKVIYRSSKNEYIKYNKKDLYNPPDLSKYNKYICNPVSAYQISYMLEGVIKYGTGRGLAYLNLPLAGKTGTTNESFDTWFIGYTPDIVVGAFVGFDEPKSLGKSETGARTALPIVRHFITQYAKDKQIRNFNIPNNIHFGKINKKTGYIAKQKDENAFFEAFKGANIKKLKTQEQANNDKKSDWPEAGQVY